jgi:hypothetical protein
MAGEAGPRRPALPGTALGPQRGAWSGSQVVILRVEVWRSEWVQPPCAAVLGLSCLVERD